MLFTKLGARPVRNVSSFAFNVCSLFSLPDGSKPEWAFSFCSPTGCAHHSSRSQGYQAVLWVIVAGGQIRLESTWVRFPSAAWSLARGCQSHPTIEKRCRTLHKHTNYSSRKSIAQLLFGFYRSTLGSLQKKVLFLEVDKTLNFISYDVILLYQHHLRCMFTN